MEGLDKYYFKHLKIMNRIRFKNRPIIDFYKLTKLSELKYKPEEELPINPDKNCASSFNNPDAQSEQLNENTSECKASTPPPFDREVLLNILRQNVVAICLYPKKNGKGNLITDFKVIGAGFNIASLEGGAIIISAEHLHDAYVDAFDPKRYETARYYPEAKDKPVLYNTDEALAFFNIGSNSCIKANIERTGGSVEYDLSFSYVKFTHKSYSHRTQLAIDTRILNKGTKIYIYAYADLEYSLLFNMPKVFSKAPIETEELFNHSFKGNLNPLFDGEITDIQEGRRDLRYRINIPVKSSMSGGLAFYIDDEGYPVAIGVISASDAVSSRAADTVKGGSSYVIPISYMMNIDLKEDGNYGQHSLLDENKREIGRTTVKTLNDLVKLGVIIDVGIA